MFEEARDRGELGSNSIEVAEDAVASFDLGMLLESIVTDLQWSTLNVGTILCLMNAQVRTGATWTLHPWRHLLQDHAQVIRLGLRFHREIGISDTTAAQTEQFYDDLADAKRELEILFVTSTAYTAAQKDMIAARLPTWRTAALNAIEILGLIENDTRVRISDVYAENGRILAQFLGEVGRGDTRRVNDWGEISLPALAQRRRTPRRSVSMPCRIVVAGREIEATLRDVSRDGMRISSPHSFAVHQRISIRLRGRAPLDAEVVWSRDGLTGAKLAAPLEGYDPILATMR